MFKDVDRILSKPTEIRTTKLDASQNAATPWKETIGKLDLSYGAEGKLNLLYQVASQNKDASEDAKIGKLQLSLGTEGKLKLTYGKAHELSHRASKPHSDTSENPRVGKLLLSYGVGPHKLKLVYQVLQAHDTQRIAQPGKLVLSYSTDRRLNLSYQAAIPDNRQVLDDDCSPIHIIPDMGV